MHVNRRRLSNATSLHCDSLVCLSLLPRIAEFLNGVQDVESLDDLSEGDVTVVELRFPVERYHKLRPVLTRRLATVVVHREHTRPGVLKIVVFIVKVCPVDALASGHGVGKQRLEIKEIPVRRVVHHLVELGEIAPYDPVRGIYLKHRPRVAVIIAHKGNLPQVRVTQQNMPGQSWTV